jgi:hypothetical protein
MFNALIMVDGFKHMWNIYDEEFLEYLAYNIIYGYIIFNDGHDYGMLEHLIRCLAMYVM